VRGGVADVERERLAPVPLERGQHAPRDLLERFVEARRAKAAAVPNERRAHAVRVAVKLADRRALRTQVAARESVALVAAHTRDAVSIERELEPAAGFADRTGAVGDALGHAWLLARSASWRTARARE
jgi:hypothetical protein